MAEGFRIDFTAPGEDTEANEYDAEEAEKNADWQAEIKIHGMNKV
mgnify:CR=1 FL=1